MRLFYLLAALGVLIAAPQDVFAHTPQQIERHVNKTPANYETDIDRLVGYLTKYFDDDYDKAQAIAFWIAGRIKYDATPYTKGDTARYTKTYRGQTAEEVLKSRSGISRDFATLFVAMCNKAHVRAYFAKGHAYPKGHKLTSKQQRYVTHVWNYFIYKGQKIYVDTTYMAGGLDAKKSLNKYNRYNFDDFYFDFTYPEERHQRLYSRKEK